MWIRDTVEILGAGHAASRVRWSSFSFSTRGMNDPVFYAWHSSAIGEVMLRDMTISHGRGDFGGCVSLVQQFGSYKLHDTVIEQCHASSGGGVAVNGALLEMNHVTLRGNTASNVGGGLHAIRGSTLLLDQAEITGNEAALDGGGMYLSQHDLASPNTLMVLDRGGTLIHDNVAGRNGGGVGIAGDVNLNMTGGVGRLQIQNNEAVGEGGGVWRGPRFLAISAMDAFFAHVDIGGNRAANGGGVAAAANIMVTLQNASLVKNSTSGGSGSGGGLRLGDVTASALLQQTSVHGNYAASGGGISAGCGSATLQNVSIQLNSATVGAAVDAAGILIMTHVTVNANRGAGVALLGRDDPTCSHRLVEVTNSLVVDSCQVAHGAAISQGGNQYGPAAMGCPALPNVDERQASSAVFGLSVGTFDGPFPVSGWNADGRTRPQVDFLSPDAWCLSGDVRGQPRNDGACDAGAFEAQ